MAERYGFIGDNWYDDMFLARWVESFISNGVYNLDMQVKAGGEMNVYINMGKGWIKGFYYEIYGEPKSFTIDQSDTVLNRIDNVVFYLDLSNKTLGTKVKKGTFSSNPVAPALVRNNEYFELKLAEISVNKNTTQITQSMVHDTRLDTNQCGIVHCVVDHIDTTTLMSQLEDWMQKYMTQSQEEFESWFNAIKFQADAVIEEAITATTNANNAAASVNEAKTAALNAADNANEKATLADNAATTANTAATNANTKAEVADTAATRANTAAAAAEEVVSEGVDVVVENKINAQKGKANGLASLNSSSKLVQMPTYVDVGAAAATHNHAAADITSGTMSIARGGTNSTTAAGALTNLGAVPATRTINNKALSSNITINAADVGAVSKESVTCHVWDAGTKVLTGWGAPYVKLIDALPSGLCCAIASNGDGVANDIRIISTEVWYGSELWIYADRPINGLIRVNYVIFQIA